MDKRRILFFIGGGYVSGLEVITLHLMKELKAAGNDVRCMVSGWNDGIFIQLLKESGIPYKETKLGWIYIRKPFWTLDGLIHHPRGFLNVKKILKEFDPVICHFCDFATPIGLFPLLKGRNCIFGLHESHLPSRKHLFLYRLLNKRIKIFTGVSKYIVNVLLNLQLPEEKIKLIYNGIPSFPEGYFKDLPDKPVQFGIIGQVVSWKGHDTVIDSVKILAVKRDLPFIIRIFGNDKNEYALGLKKRIQEEKLEKYFIWEGFVREQDMIYREVDSVLVPSLSQEPCSLAILESMTRGKGVIVSDRGGNTELVNDGEDGLVFNAGNPEALADRMLVFLEDRHRLSFMGRKARQKALEAFASKRMMEQYLEIYNEVGA